MPRHPANIAERFGAVFLYLKQLLDPKEKIS
jgi:hypothetical protein